MPLVVVLIDLLLQCSYWTLQAEHYISRMLPTYKVEGAKINTPSKSNTYKHLPIANTLQP